MSRKKHHTPAEIAAKLAEADELAAQGKLQTEISRLLNVSIMTLHRWRRLAESKADGSSTQPEPAVPVAHSKKETDRIAELKLENSRLRRLVTDLMLEKVALQERYIDPDKRRANRRK